MCFKIPEENLLKRGQQLDLGEKRQVSFSFVHVLQLSSFFPTISVCFYKQERETYTSKTRAVRRLSARDAPLCGGINETEHGEATPAPGTGPQEGPGASDSPIFL